MTEIAPRLLRCFHSVFPELDDAAIERAEMTNVSRWDSVNQIMLVTVVGEEFGVDLDLEDLDQLVSYQGILNYLSRMPS